MTDDAAPRRHLSRTAEEWDEVAAGIGLEWLEPVENGATPTKSRCLVRREGRARLLRKRFK